MQDSQQKEPHIEDSDAPTSLSRGDKAFLDSLLFLSDNLVLRVLEELKNEDVSEFGNLIEKHRAAEDDNGKEVLAFLHLKIENLDAIIKQESDAFTKRSGTRMAAAFFMEQKE